MSYTQINLDTVHGVLYVSAMEPPKVFEFIFGDQDDLIINQEIEERPHLPDEREPIPNTEEPEDV